MAGVVRTKVKVCRLWYPQSLKDELDDQIFARLGV
jgi:hypothetical protein